MYCAAGILPLALHQGQVLVLLGNEPTSLGLRWLAFGGKKEAVDGDEPVSTALREFHEESGNLFLAEHVQLVGPRFYDFQAKYVLFLAWLPYTEQLPAFSAEQAAVDPTLNKRELRWFPLEALLQGDQFELDGPFPIKPWFQRMIQRERYAIRRACMAPT